MKPIMFLFLPALAACAQAPEVRQVPVPVPIPIAVPCAAKVPAKPAWKRGLLDLETATGDEKVAALEAELIQREAYEDQLTAAIVGCQKGKS